MMKLKNAFMVLVNDIDKHVMKQDIVLVVVDELFKKEYELTSVLI